MSPLTIGMIGAGALLVLIAVRVPIAVALGSVSLLGIWAVRGMDAMLGAARSMPYDFIAKWELSAVPMFLLMGAVAYHSGLTAGLYRVARLWLSRLPGGLAVATNFASAGFAAASGSSLATAAAMGRLAIPEMTRYRYDPGLSTGVVAAAGTLGSLIPPSILMVLYGMFASQPISKLLIAGILPGLLTAVVYATMIIGRCMLNPKLAPPIEEKVTWGERLRALAEVWQLPVLILGVVGSIYSGLASATEAAALGSFFAILVAILSGSMTSKVMRDSLVETLQSTASIFFIGLGAIFFTRFLAFCGVPQFMGSLAQDFAVDPVLMIIAVSVVYLILGMFLDPLGLMLLTLPVFLPFFEAANMNLIWVGVLVVKYIEIGLITPPVGLNAFVVKGVVGNAISLTTIFRGLLWFIGAEIVILVILISFPEISLFLPNMMD